MSRMKVTNMDKLKDYNREWREKNTVKTYRKNNGEIRTSEMNRVGQMVWESILPAKIKKILEKYN